MSGRIFRAGAIFALAVSLAAAAAAWTDEVYVWQREFDGEVAAALRTFEPQLGGACVLAAEVAWRGGKLEVVRPSVEFAALASCTRPVGLALRIGAYGGTFAGDDAAARALIALAHERLGAARAAGLRVAELQVDFDCAESKLAGYRVWIGSLRAAIAPVPPVMSPSSPITRQSKVWFAIDNPATVHCQQPDTPPKNGKDWTFAPST